MTAKITLIHEWLQKGMPGVCLKKIPIIYKTLSPFYNKSGNKGTVLLSPFATLF